jgi:hypothetical protein
MKNTLIRIGHSAYTGANSYRLCFSKAQAVRVLLNKGVKRDAARRAVDKALADHGATVYGDYFEVVEVVNETHSLKQGYYMATYEELRANWSSKPEF